MRESATPTLTPDADEVSVLTATGIRAKHKSSSICAYNFRQSGFLARSELRRFRQRHEQFVNALAGRLARLMRVDLNLQPAKVHVVGYGQFIESLAPKTHTTLFRTDPLQGVGLLVMSPALGLTLVAGLRSRLDEMPEKSRDLTELEVALVDQVVNLVICEWWSQWPEMRELKPVLLGHQSHSRLLRTEAPETAMVIFTIAVGAGGESELIQLAFPHRTVEPLMRLLCPSQPVAEGSPSQGKPLRWNPEFNEIKVPVLAEWKGLKMSAGDISDLKAGDLLMLDPGCTAPVEILFNHIPKFTGRPGTIGRRWAIQLTTAVNQNPTL